MSELENMLAQSERTWVLLKRIRAGETHLFDELFLRHGTRLLVYIEFRLGPILRARMEARDVLQDVYAITLRKLPELEASTPGAFYTWLKTTARWHLRNLRR